MGDEFYSSREGTTLPLPKEKESHGQTMDKVFIEALEIETVIGIYDWEREIKQVISIDLEMAWDNKPAAEAEDIQYALNYKSVSKRLLDFIGGSEFLLVETMAEAIAQIILIEFKATWLNLKLRKPGAIRGAKAVGVQIERTEADIESVEKYAPQPAMLDAQSDKSGNIHG